LFRLAICDDEPEQIEVLKSHIIRVLFRFDIEATIAAFTGAEALLEECRAGRGFELIFLDIALAGENGIEAAKLIRGLDRKALVVFVTGSSGYLMQGYEARAFRYLVKPATEEMMEDVMRQAIREMQLIESDSICFRENGEDIRVDLADIIYFEAQNHRVFLACSNATHNFYGRIGEIEKRLSGKGFVRCQKGYLVNAVRIRRIGKLQVLLDNGSTLPVSSNYLRQRKDTFLTVLR
jgi:two-component system, LytTR family, response regulator LytT